MKRLIAHAQWSMVAHLIPLMLTCVKKHQSKQMKNSRDSNGAYINFGIHADTLES